jgi:hypothetical protein
MVASCPLLGVKKKFVTALNAKALEKARYHRRTDMGLSDKSFTHCPSHPIYGTGIGSGKSSTIWC